MKTKKESIISVVMSTLNTDKEFLKQAIDSILNQTYKNLEFIIIVDGGDDDVFIKNNYNDDRIKIIKHERTMGLPYSLNEGIRQSHGDYVARMDSDDISLPDRLKIEFDFLEDNNDVDIVSMHYQRIGASSEIIREKAIHSSQIRCKLFFLNIIAHPTVMFRKKSIIEKNLYYDENYRYSQDYELWSRYDNVNIEIIPQIGLKYRIHANQISTAKSEQQRMYYHEILKRNLLKLHISDENIDNLLVLNNLKKDDDYKKIYNFIQILLINNDKYLVFDRKEFKKILMRKFEIFCIKNKCVLNLSFIKNLTYLF